MAVLKIWRIMWPEDQNWGMLNRVDKRYSHMRLTSKSLRTLMYINLVMGCGVCGFYFGQVVASDGVNFSEYPEFFTGGLVIFGGIGATLRIASKRKKKSRKCNPVELLNVRENIIPVPLEEIIRDKNS